MEKITWNRLPDDWMGITDIIIYGFGRVAQRNIKKLKMDFNIKFIIDNNPDWQIIQDKCDIEIMSLKDAKPFIKSCKIVVATSSLAYESIKGDLLNIGMKEYIDFCRLETFMPTWYWENKKEVCISQVLSAVTTKCTFRCRCCSNLMPYFKEQYEYNADDIFEDLSLLFKRIDYLASYYLMGGEPLLNKELPEIVSRICENFAHLIGYIQIITNGSIIPSEELLYVMNRYDVKVRISDYTRIVPYKSKFEEVIKAFKRGGVEYSISDYKAWMDLGFPHESLNITDDLHQHMLNCSQGCHSVNDKKFYYCSTLWDAEKSGLYVLNENDYIDLRKSTGDLEIDKIQILKYCLGVAENDYISLCKKCRGFGSDNIHRVRVAEQMNL